MAAVGYYSGGSYTARGELEVRINIGAQGDGSRINSLPLPSQSTERRTRAPGGEVEALGAN